VTAFLPGMLSESSAVTVTVTAADDAAHSFGEAVHLYRNTAREAGTGGKS
jgi:hypothetical protein